MSHNAYKKAAKLEEECSRVSIHGMFDCHLFHDVTGDSVDGVIANWLERNTPPDKKYGPSCLCPAIVLNGKVELRRAGAMIHNIDDTDAIALYRAALLADPDIPRLLAKQATP